MLGASSDSLRPIRSSVATFRAAASLPMTIADGWSLPRSIREIVASTIPAFSASWACVNPARSRSWRTMEPRGAGAGVRGMRRNVPGIPVVRPCPIRRSSSCLSMRQRSILRAVANSFPTEASMGTSTTQYWIAKPGSTDPPIGPLDLLDIIERVNVGAIPRDASACRIGSSSWFTLSQLLPPVAQPIPSSAPSARLPESSVADPFGAIAFPAGSRFSIPTLPTPNVAIPTLPTPNVAIPNLPTPNVAIPGPDVTISGLEKSPGPEASKWGLPTPSVPLLQTTDGYYNLEAQQSRRGATRRKRLQTTDGYYNLEAVGNSLRRYGRIVKILGIVIAIGGPLVSFYVARDALAWVGGGLVPAFLGLITHSVGTMFMASGEAILALRKIAMNTAVTAFNTAAKGTAHG